MSVMRASAVVIAAVGALGCADEPRVFRADAGPRDTGTADRAIPVDTGELPVVDAGVAVDRPPVQTMRDFVRPGTPTDAPTAPKTPPGPRRWSIPTTRPSFPPTCLHSRSISDPVRAMTSSRSPSPGR